MISSFIIISVISALIVLTMGIALLAISNTFPKTIKGIKEWGGSYTILSVYLLMFLLHEIFPDFISVILGNFSIVAAYTLMYLGSVRFLKMTLFSRNQIIVIFSIFLLTFILLSCFTSQVKSQVLTLSLYCCLILFMQILLFKSKSKSLGSVLVLISLALLFLVQVFRSVSVLFDFFEPQHIYDISVSSIIDVSMPAIIIPLATMGFILLLSQEHNETLNYISRHDSLTGSLNKKTFIEVLQNQIIYAKRYKNKLSVIMMDLDDFKNVNDRHGHLAGDAVLVDFVRKAKTCLRETDRLARFGGDEFIAILPNTGIVEARSVAKRIYEQGGASKNQVNIPWNVSTGVAEWVGDQDTFENLVTRADRDLYKTKELRSNQQKTS